MTAIADADDPVPKGAPTIRMYENPLQRSVPNDHRTLDPTSPPTVPVRLSCGSDRPVSIHQRKVGDLLELK